MNVYSSLTSLIPHYFHSFFVIPCFCPFFSIYLLVFIPCFLPSFPASVYSSFLLSFHSFFLPYFHISFLNSFLHCILQFLPSLPASVYSLHQYFFPIFSPILSFPPCFNIQHFSLLPSLLPNWFSCYPLFVISFLPYFISCLFLLPSFH